jgi:hypothetical protein
MTHRPGPGPNGTLSWVDGLRAACGSGTQNVAGCAAEDEHLSVRAVGCDGFKIAGNVVPLDRTGGHRFSIHELNASLGNGLVAVGTGSTAVHATGSSSLTRSDVRAATPCSHDMDHF